MKRILPDMKTGFRDEGGQTLVLVTLSVFVLMGFLGLAIDVGNLRSQQHKLQGIADAAALAGAIEISYCGGTADCSYLTGAAGKAVVENGLTVATELDNAETTCTMPTGHTGVLLMVNNGPCLLGSTTADPNYNNTNTVETLVQADVPVYFAGLVGLSNPVRISARSEAGLHNSSFCVYGLSEIDVSSGGKVNMPNCAGMDDGPLKDQHGNGACNWSQMTSKFFDVAGHICNSNQFTPAATAATALPDPFASLSAPNTVAGYNPTCVTLPWGVSKTSPGTGAPPYNLSPGHYCATSGTSMTISSGDTVNLSPGTYVFDGAVNANGNLFGTGGVTLYFTAGTLNIGGWVDLVAPTTTCQAESGANPAGIVLWESSTDSTGFTIQDGSHSTTLQGAVYLPDATLDVKSGGQLGLYTILVANKVLMGDGGTVNIGADYSTLACGSPVKQASASLVE